MHSELPPGVAAPILRREPPASVAADPYSALRDAFNALAPRSRVVLVLRIGVRGRAPLTLEAIGLLIDLGPERVRQLYNSGVAGLCAAWRYRATRGLSQAERSELLAPIIDAAVDRFPMD